MCSSATTGISACYPLILCVSCFLFLLHKLLPSLFALLVSSSPVIACTFLLLGILLILGESNVPQNEEEDDGTVQAISKIHLNLKNRGIFKSKAPVGSSRRALRRLKVKAAVLGDRKVYANGVTQVDSASVDSNSCLEEDDERGKNKKSNGKKNAVKAGKKSAAKLEDCFDACSASSSSSSSDIKSEEEEKRNSQVANGASVLNELDRLFESDHKSAGGVQDEEEEEEDDDDDDDDDETQEETEDVSRAAVKFTADDERVLMELRKSELERNRRLEHILTWRRARQVREKNLIDLDDGNEGNPHRRNPFDLPGDLDEPASAPSMLLPRRNPFDLPSNHEAAGDNNSSNWDFVPPRDALILRRHESFSVGGSFFSGFRQEKRSSRFKPFFGAEINKQFSEASDPKTGGSTSKNQHQVSQSEQDSSESVDAERLEKRMNKNKDQTTSSSIGRPEMVHQARELSFSSPSETGKSASKVSTQEQTAVDQSANNAADEGRPNHRRQRLERSFVVKRDDQQSEASSSGFSWYAAPSLSSVDEIESESKGISVIKEFDVIGDELRRVRQDFGGPGLKVDSPTLLIRQQLLRSDSSSVKAESEEES